MSTPKRRLRKHNIPKRELPELCFCCDSHNPWVEVVLNQEAEFRHKFHSIKATMTQCRYCNTTTATPEQNAVVMQTIRKMHRLSIREDILSAKKSLGMNIRDLADATNIGVATLQRALKAESLIDGSTEEMLHTKVTHLNSEKIKSSFLDLLKADFEAKNRFSTPASDISVNLPMFA